MFNLVASVEVKEKKAVGKMRAVELRGRPKSHWRLVEREAVRERTASSVE